MPLAETRDSAAQMRCK